MTKFVLTEVGDLATLVNIAQTVLESKVQGDPKKQRS